MSALNLVSEPVVSSVCTEKNGSIERHVYKMALTQESVKLFWEKARKFDTLFTQEIKNDFRLFLSVFLDENDGVIEGRGLLWRIDDYVGIFYLTDISPENDAQVHVTFFDGRIKGRENLAIDMLRFAFKVYQFRRLSAVVPMYAATASHSFIRRIGFKIEGRKRLSCGFKGSWYDTVQYGILASEVK